MRVLGSKILAAFIVTIAATGGGIAEDAVEDVHRQCGAEYADPFALAKCLKAEEKDYGKKLAETYRKVVELQTPDTKKALIEAQRTWLTFQEKNCKFHRSVLSAAFYLSMVPRTAMPRRRRACCARQCSASPNSRRCCKIWSTEGRQLSGHRSVVGLSFRHCFAASPCVATSRSARDPGPLPFPPAPPRRRSATIAKDAG
jgi:uncharacterized protein YecT (DUF1311 family)